MNFEFATAGRIVFGAGTSAAVGTLARECGIRALLVHGADASRAAGVAEALDRAGLECARLSVLGEPTVALAVAGAAAARDFRAEVVVACGGGSVIDAGKAVAALAVNDGDPMEYLEVIGRGRPLGRDPLPCIALPTTAGTGAEATRNAVLGSPEHRVKASLRSPRMLPRVAVVDPELALGLPPRPTATTGLDALAQLVEPFVGLRRNPFTDALCRDGIPRAVRALPRAFARGCDGDARAEMAFAALLGGMALANSGLGAVHGLAGPLGGMYGAPHGALCAALLAPVWRANAAATARGGGTAGRHREAARLLTGSQAATAEDGGRWLGDFVAGFDLGGLRSLGVPRSEFDTVAGKAAASSSMKGNPVALSREELVAILEEAW